MRIDLGLILGVIVECIAFIYYSNTLFYRKRSKLFFAVAVTLGYAAHFVVCTFGNVVMNMLTYFLLHVTVFMLCFHIQRKTAVFQSMMLNLLTTLCEFASVYIWDLGINGTNLVDISAMQSMILTISGRSLYLIGIMILTYICKKNSKLTDVYSILFIVIQIFTMIIMYLTSEKSNDNSFRLTICIICGMVDVTAFILNQNFVTQRLENEALKIQIKKDENDFKDFMALKHLHHDMNEHSETLYSLIDSNNERAKEYIESLNSKKKQFINIVDYTDNRMINIVISKKMDECRENGIIFTFDPVQADLTFFQDMDAVAVFSNLINNAIESCKNSKEKKIYMSIYTVNKNFVVIKIINSSDKKPIVIDGKLKTHKDNDKFHGIGISSIKQTLKEYNGTLSWSYDEKMRRFCNTITIQPMSKKC